MTPATRGRLLADQHLLDDVEVRLADHRISQGANAPHAARIPQEQREAMEAYGARLEQYRSRLARAGGDEGRGSK